MSSDAGVLMALDRDDLDVPGGWRAREFGGIASEVRQRAGDPKATFPVLSVTKHRGIVRADEFFKKTVHGRDLSQYKVVTAGELAYATIHLDEGSVGHLLKHTAERGLVSPMYTVFKIIDETVDGAFLLTVLKHPSSLPVYRRLGRGTVNRRASVPFEDLSRIWILCPPIPEQRKIAAILSSVHAAMEATQDVINQLQVLKKAMMAELLTRGLPGSHRRFKKTELGEVPEEWEVVRFGDVCERMFVGIAQAATHAYVQAGGVPLVRTTNLRENVIVVDDVLQISDAFAAQMRSKALRTDDVLTARTGTPGTSAVVPSEFNGAQCFTLLVSRPGPRIRSKFMCHVMNSHLGDRLVAQGQAGGAQQNLNVGVFESSLVALPEVAEQDELAQQIDSVYTRIKIEEQTLQTIRDLKAALASGLLTGEVRVKAADRIEDAA